MAKRIEERISISATSRPRLLLPLCTSHSILAVSMTNPLAVCLLLLHLILCLLLPLGLFINHAFIIHNSNLLPGPDSCLHLLPSSSLFSVRCLLVVPSLKSSSNTLPGTTQKAQQHAPQPHTPEVWLSNVRTWKLEAKRLSGHFHKRTTKFTSCELKDDSSERLLQTSRDLLYIVYKRYSRS